MRRQSVRLRLIGSTALAAGLIPALAQAQGFQASSSVQAGAAVVGTTATSTTVTVGGANGATAVINWVPTDNTGVGPIDFLPAGRTATFVNDPSATAGYTVINRVLPVQTERPVQFGGQVTSLINNAGVNTPGGTILFYSPAGVIIGPTAGLDVGNLVLTTADPQVIAGGFRLVSAVGSTSEVDVRAGASITAFNPGSYVALVAPRVRMNGQVNVNGIAAYVAAEGADITIDAGLYSIAVTDGTDPQGTPEILTHGGVTALGDPSIARQRAVMVAMSKNDAISILVDGQVTLAAATGVVTQGPDILLVSGFPGASAARAVSVPGDSNVNPNALADISLVATRIDAPITAEGSGAATLTLNGEDATYGGSAFLLGRRVTTINVGLSTPDTLTIDGDLAIGFDFAGRGRTANINIGSGATLNVTGDLGIELSDRGNAFGLSGVGGTIDVTVRAGATLSVGGGLSLIADGIGAADRDTLPGGSGDGGVVAFTMDELSAATIGNDVLIRADGEGFGGARGGFGGTATLEVTGAALGAANLIVSADGRSGGRGFRELVSIGGAGGAAQILASLETTITAQSATVTADFTGSGERGRSGAGGTATVLAGSADTVIVIDETLTVSASGSGGRAFSGAGGDGVGGTAQLFAIEGTVRASGASADPQIIVRAEGSGGAAFNTGGGAGGSGTGGSAIASATGGGSIGLGGVTPAFSISAWTIATGGEGAPGPAGGTGGAATGGISLIAVDTGGRIEAFVLSADATAFGGAGGAGLASGNGGDGGAGLGGDAAIDLPIEGLLTLISRGDPASVSVRALGFGGLGGAGGDTPGPGPAGRGGGGGTGQGGLADLVLGADSRLQSSGPSNFDIALTIEASAYGGAGAAGGAALSPGAVAGGNGGAGGTGESGTASATVEDSTLDDGLDRFTLNLTTNAVGGAGGQGGRGGGTASGGDGGSGGSGLGSGSAGFTLGDFGSVFIDTLRLTTDSAGGAGGAAAPGGAGGSGGAAASAAALVQTSDVLTELDVRSLQVTASAVGGAGGGTLSYSAETIAPGPGGAGGAAAGGTVTLVIPDTESSLVSDIGEIIITADGIGGAGADGTSPPSGLSASNGGAGGAATGGGLSLDLDGGVDVPSITLSASSTGGRGGTGGTAVFTGDVNIRGGDGGSGGAAVGGTTGITFRSNLTVNPALGVSLVARTTSGNGGSGGAPPSESAPLFIAGVLANGPVYDFGEAALAGDITASAIAFESELTALELSSLSLNGLFLTGDSGMTSVAFLDASNTPRIGTIAAFGAPAYSPGPGSSIIIGGQSITALSLSASFGGDATLDGTDSSALVATNVLLQGQNSFVINRPVSADESLTVQGGTITVNAELTADVISATTSELNILAPVTARAIGIETALLSIGAPVGNASTETIRITGFGDTEIGGTTGSGLFISSADFANLRATQITIRALGNLLLNDLAIGGTDSSAPNLNRSAAPGVNPTVVFGAEGTLNVRRAVTLAEAGPSDQLGLIALGELAVLTESGSAAVLDVEGGETGRLYVRAPRIGVATADTLGLTGLAATSAERNAILRDTRDVLSVEGFLRGGRISVRAAERFWVANSGDVSEEFAGLTTGAGGLDIRSSLLDVNDFQTIDLADFETVDEFSISAGPAEVLAFGRSLVDGVPTTGEAFTNLVDANPEDATADSLVNDCSLFSDCGPPPIGAFQGEPAVTAGDVTIDRGAASDTITIGFGNDGVGIIDWSPSDTTGFGPIDFLPAGRTGLFQGELGLGDFTVINRVLPLDPSRPIALNGTVTAQIRDLDGNATPGGRVVFFAPAGVIIGATGVFDVGRLLLTSGDPILQSNGSWRLDSTDGAAAVEVQAGAVITALTPGGSVALVAPTVRMSGDVQVNGTAAYVAAAEVDLLIDANGHYTVLYGDNTIGSPSIVDHLGSTTGPGEGGEQLSTVLLTAQPLEGLAPQISLFGTSGFDSGGAVVLAGGLDDPSARGFIGLRDGAPFPSQFAELSVLPSEVRSALFAGGESVRLDASDGDAIFRAPVVLQAFGDIILNLPSAEFSLSFEGGLSAFAGGGVSVDGPGTLSASSLSLSGLTGVTLAAPTIVSGLVDLSSSGFVSLAGTLSADQLNVTLSEPIDDFIDFGEIRIEGALDIASSASFTSYADFVADVGLGIAGSLTIVAGNVVTLGGAAAGGGITIQADGGLNAGDLSSPGDIVIDSLQDVAIGSVNAGALSVANANSFLSGAITADGGVSLTTLNALEVDGDLSAGQLDILTQDTQGLVTLGGSVNVSGDATVAIDGFFISQDNEPSFIVAGDFSAGRLDLRARAGLLQFDGALTTLNDLTVRLAQGLAVIGPVNAGSIDIDIGGAARFESDVTTAGAASFLVDNEAISFGASLSAATLLIDASGTTGAVALTGPVSVAGDAVLRSGTEVVADDLIEAGALAVTAASDVRLAGLAAGSLAITASEDVSIGGAVVTGGATIDAGGSLDVNSLLQAGSLTILADSVQLQAIAASGAVSLTSTNALTLGETLSAESLAVITTAAGADVALGALALTGALTVNSAGALTGGEISAGSLTTASAGATSLGALTIGGAADLVSGGTLTLQAGVRTGSLLARATGVGAAARIGAVTADGAVAIFAAGDADAGALSASELTISAGGSATLNGASSVTGLAFVGAGGAAIFNAGLAAGDISVNAADVVIGEAARLGGLSTNRISFGTNSSAESVTVGGTGQDGFSIDAEELSRLTARTIAINAGDYAMTVGDVALNGSASSRPNLTGSVFELTSNGDIRVEGSIAIQEARADDTIRITSGGLLHVVTPGGRLAIRNSREALDGRVELTGADRVLVGSDSVNEAVQAAATIEERRIALSQNDGPVRPQGYLEAGAITLRADNAIQVQNSGGRDGPLAGLTVGAGGLFVERASDSASAPVEVIGYGRGIFERSAVTGFAFTRTIAFVPSEVDARSLWNDCLLFSSSCGGQAFQGAPTVEAGAAAFDRSNTLDLITIGSNAEAAVIRWMPSDSEMDAGPIDFLPQGRSGIFRGAPGLDGFTIINRVLPADPNRPIMLNGTVLSQLVSVTGVVRTGGTVVFYSPGGVIIGATGRFDIGSLLLSAADVTSVTGNRFTLDAAADSAGLVAIEAGGEVNAVGEGSFVALFGPRVRNAGDIDVAGTAAFVSAEAGELSFGTDGSYTFDVTRGARVPDGNRGLDVGPELQHLVSLTGSVSGPDGGARNLVAAVAPRNGFATIFVEGDFGWGVRPDAALTFPAGASAGSVTLPGSLGGVGSVAFRGGMLSSSVDVAASRSFTALSGTIDSSDDRGRALRFRGDVRSRTSFGTSFAAGSGLELSVDGSVDVGPLATGRLTRGLFEAVADGGTITIGGGLTAVAPSLTAADDPRVVGGLAELRASNGGLITVGGDAALDASGAGGPLSSSLEPVEGNRGGTVAVSALSGGAVSITGPLTLTANATGAGDVRGGAIEIVADSGSISAGRLEAVTRASGNAGGGDIAVMAVNAAAILADSLTLNSLPGTPGPAPGGMVNVTTEGTGLRVRGDLGIFTGALTIAGGGRLLAGDLTVFAAARFDASTAIEAERSILIDVRGVTTLASLDAGEAITIEAFGPLSASGGIVARSAELLSTGDVRLLGAVSTADALRITGASVRVDGAIAGGQTGIVASGAIELARVEADSLSLVAGGAATLRESVTVANLLAIDVRGAVSAPARLSAGDLTLAAGSADLADVVVIGDVSLTVDGRLNFGALSAGSLSASAGEAALGRVSVRDAALIGAAGPIAFDGPVSAASLSVTATGADGRIDLTGAAAVGGDAVLEGSRAVTLSSGLSARTVTIDAGDVAIGANAAVGGAETTRVTFRTSAAKASSATVGGAARAAGFQLDAAELGRVRANDILVDSGFGRSDGLDLSVGGFVLQGSASATPNLNGSVLSIAAGRALTVSGVAQIANAGANDALLLLASTDLRFALPSGGASVTGPNGALTGQLYLLGQRVLAGFPQTLSAIDEGLSGQALRQALALNTGLVRPEGYLQADRISVRAAGSFLAQNTGTAGLYAGLSVGPGGLDLRQGVLNGFEALNIADPAALDGALRRTGEADVIAFGRRVTASDTAINAAFLPFVRFIAADVTENSEVNGCLLRGGDCLNPLQDGDPLSSLELITEMIVRPSTDAVIGLTEDDEEDDDDADVSPAENATRRAGDDTPPIIVPMLDTRLVDPTAVTIDGALGDPAGGAGNEATWTTETGTNTTLELGGGGAGGDAGQMGGAGGGMGSTSSVGSERNPGTTGDDGAADGGDAGQVGGASGGMGGASSVGSERNPGTTGADQLSPAGAADPAAASAQEPPR